MITSIELRENINMNLLLLIVKVISQRGSALPEQRKIKVGKLNIKAINPLSNEIYCFKSLLKYPFFLLALYVSIEFSKGKN